MKKVPCEVFSRVVGYYRPVQSWNTGKQQEFAERTAFNMKVSLSNSVAQQEIEAVAH